MKKTLVTLLLALAAGAAGAADPWAESYRLEYQKKYLEAAAQIEPFAKSGEFAQLRHAWLLYLAGRLDQSVAEYRRAQQANPNSLDAMLGVTLPLMAQWKWKEAADAARAVLRYAPWHYAASLRLIVILEAQKQWAPMGEEAEKLAQRYPSMGAPWVYLARAEAGLGQAEKARAAYRKVLEIAPADVEASAYLRRQ